MAGAKAKKYPPFCPWYVDAWLSDPHVQAMTPAARGAYFQLLMHAWRATPPCTIPGDDQQLATLAGMSLLEWSGVRDLVLAAWSRYRGRWRQKRLFAEFRASLKKMKSTRAKCTKAANARWNRNNPPSKKLGDDPPDASCIALRSKNAMQSDAYRDRDRYRDPSPSSKSARNISRGNSRAKPDSGSEFFVEGTDSDSGLGVTEVDRALAKIRSVLGIMPAAAIVMKQFKDPTIRKQRLADITDWRQNLEPAIRRGLDDGFLLHWFVAQAKQCASLKKPPAAFRRRLKDADISVGSAKSLARAIG